MQPGSIHIPLSYRTFPDGQMFIKLGEHGHRLRFEGLGDDEQTVVFFNESTGQQESYPVTGTEPQLQAIDG
jgi:hypothetical protein